MSQAIAIWIIGGLLTALIGLLAWGGKYVISVLEKMAKSMNEMSTQVAVFGVLTETNQEAIEKNEIKTTGISAQVKDHENRLIVIETEHRLKQCNFKNH